MTDRKSLIRKINHLIKIVSLGKYNPMVACKSLPDVDFREWIEQPRGGYQGDF